MNSTSGDLSIGAIGERALIERIRARAGAPAPWITLGIGDDAAVIVPERGRVDVVTTDSLVEDVHFRREWTDAAAIGHKSLAVNLSDLAAMGASPRAAFLSLALPVTLALGEFDAMIDGFAALAERERVPLAGGNLTRSPQPIVIDVTLIGSAHPRRLLTRSGGRPGDALYVTGSAGGAAAGLAMLRAGVDRASLDEARLDCLRRHERPDARLSSGVQVARNRAASACVDLSDGLADAARRIADASGCGVELDAAAIPVHPGARAWADAAGADPVALAVSGGEDYELLFAVGKRQRRAFFAATARCRGVAFTCVGRLTKERGAWLIRHDRKEPLAEGFAHF
jgi:thiamine-monophosphate kinase